MGYRLEGPVISHREGVEKSIISKPSVPGGIQVPPDGQPIILLIEQTVGGYTKIATVISTDIGAVGQTKPGDRIRFKAVDLKEHINSMSKVKKKSWSSGILSFTKRGPN